MASRGVLGALDRHWGSIPRRWAHHVQPVPPPTGRGSEAAVAQTTRGGQSPPRWHRRPPCLRGARSPACALDPAGVTRLRKRCHQAQLPPPQARTASPPDLRTPQNHGVPTARRAASRPPDDAEGRLGRVQLVFFSSPSIIRHRTADFRGIRVPIRQANRGHSGPFEAAPNWPGAHTGAWRDGTVGTQNPGSRRQSTPNDGRSNEAQPQVNGTVHH